MTSQLAYEGLRALAEISAVFFKADEPVICHGSL